MSITTTQSRWPYGTEVRVFRTIRNDGSNPTLAKGDILARRGSVGYVLRSGPYLSDQWVYEVHFPELQRTVGCLERELQAASEPFILTQFERGDIANLKADLHSQGTPIAQRGDPVKIIAIQQLQPTIEYRVQHHDMTFTLPEAYLEHI